jgi:hypothetical protein
MWVTNVWDVWWIIYITMYVHICICKCIYIVCIYISKLKSTLRNLYRSLRRCICVWHVLSQPDGSVVQGGGGGGDISGQPASCDSDQPVAYSQNNNEPISRVTQCRTRHVQYMHLARKRETENGKSYMEARRRNEV